LKTNYKIGRRVPKANGWSIAIVVLKMVMLVKHASTRDQFWLVQQIRLLDLKALLVLVVVS